MTFSRIAVDPAVMRGAPCVAGTRIPVAMLVRMVGQGISIDDIVADYPQLSAEDVLEAVRFAAASVDRYEYPLTETA